MADGQWTWLHSDIAADAGINGRETEDLLHGNLSLYPILGSRD